MRGIGFDRLGANWYQCVPVENRSGLPPKPPKPAKKKKRNATHSVHARLFVEDIARLKKIAEQHGLPWQIELRLLVHRALRGEQRDIVVIKE